LRVLSLSFSPEYSIHQAPSLPTRNRSRLRHERHVNPQAAGVSAASANPTPPPPRTAPAEECDASFISTHGHDNQDLRRHQYQNDQEVASGNVSRPQQVPLGLSPRRAGKTRQIFVVQLLHAAFHFLSVHVRDFSALLGFFRRQKPIQLAAPSAVEQPIAPAASF